MPTFTPTRFYHAQPGTSDGELVGVGSPATKKIVKQVVLANTTASSATVTINLNPGAAASAAANQVVPTVSVPPNTVITLDVSWVLGATDTMRGLQGTASAITVSIHGVTF